MVANLAKCFVFVSFFCVTAATSGADESPLKDLTPTQLVQQLGDDSQAVRDAAAAELRARGADSEQALLKGLTIKDDAEIHSRCIRLLGWIEHDVRERKLAEFTSGKPGPFNLPGWKRIEAVAKDTPASRKFYASMFREFQDELVDIDHSDVDVAKQIAATLTARLQKDQLNGQTVDPELLIAITLISCSDERFFKANTYFRETMTLYSYLSRSNVKQVVTGGDQKEILIGLLANWVEQNVASSYGGYAIKVAMTYELKDTCLTASRKMLQKNPNANSNSAMPYAMLCLARFGAAEDTEILKPYLKNTRSCHSWSNARLAKKLIRTQIRDVALATTIHLAGQDPADYGFQYLVRNEETVFTVYCMGFTEDADREATHIKWKSRHTFEEPPAP